MEVWYAVRSSRVSVDFVWRHSSDGSSSFTFSNSFNSNFLGFLTFSIHVQDYIHHLHSLPNERDTRCALSKEETQSIRPIFIWFHSSKKIQPFPNWVFGQNIVPILGHLYNLLIGESWWVRRKPGLKSSPTQTLIKQHKYHQGSRFQENFSFVDIDFEFTKLFNIILPKRTTNAILSGFQACLRFNE